MKDSLNVLQKECLIKVSNDRTLKSAIKENPFIKFRLDLKNEYTVVTVGHSCLTWQWRF